MKKIFIAASFASTLLLAGCFSMGTGTTGQTTATTTTNNSQAVGTLANALLGATGSTSTQGGQLTSLLGSVLGQFINTTNSNTIVGSWTYSQPSVQFESSNLLAQAGGAVASQTVANKLAPYYEKVGLKAGVAKFIFNSDMTASMVLSGRTISGTYTFNSTTGTLTFSMAGSVNLFTAYVSVSGNQMSLTMDASKVLSLIQSLGSKTNNSTVSSISSLASSFSGMKTGFLFVK